MRHYSRLSKVLAFGLVPTLCAGIAAAATQPQLSEDTIDQVIAALSLQEKVELVTGVPRPFPGAPTPQGPTVGLTPRLVPGAAGTTLTLERLGITPMVLADGPAGLRILPRREGNDRDTFFCTAFPIATLLASSWDVELVEDVGRAIGAEVKEYGVDVLLAPALNLHRYPLGGRNFEYYSEDPLVSGKMAAAMVRGVQSQGVGTSIKHYVANNHEWNRRVLNVKVSERALREIYLRGFERAVKEGKPWTVMTSYNKVNGTYTSQSAHLLTEILREQWGFDGLVMTDWGGGDDPVAQMIAGNDLLMPGRQEQQEALVTAVENGTLDEAILDRNIRHILSIVVRSPRYAGLGYDDKPDLEGHAQVSREAATQGMVLLKNNKATLPLTKGASVALLGTASYETVIGGLGSGDVNEAYIVSVHQGLAAAGLKLHTKLSTEYDVYIKAEKAKQPPRQRFMPPPPPVGELMLAPEKLDQLAAQTDVAVYTLGRISGEFRDREAADDFYLKATEKELVGAIARAFHAKGKRLVVLLNIGGVIETPSWRDQADAILLTWQPGQEAGHAIAEVLLGVVNPSGKLATTFAMKLEDYLAAENFPGKVLLGPDPNSRMPAFMRGARDAELTYTDDIWVGYRHFVSHNVATAYPFGFGLSYTHFDYSDLTLSSDKLEEELTVTVKVTNSGKVAGKEVVQLYVAAPHGSLKKPAAELRAFAKTRLLKPKETQTLAFTLHPVDVSSWETASSSWVAEAGTYVVQVGASSTDIRLSKEFQLAASAHTKP